MIAVFGGTFDPVHNGHLRIALELYQQLGLDEVRFVPCRQPPHRAMPQARDDQRVAMLERATAGQAEFVIDQRELLRDGPSYMVDTLASVRAEETAQSVCLIVGGDAFSQLAGWYRWTRLLELAHIVVAERPGSPRVFNDELMTYLHQHQVSDPAELQTRFNGCILRCPVTQLEISSMAIRGQLALGNSVRYLVPDDVSIYIQQQHLYSVKT